MKKTILFLGVLIVAASVVQGQSPALNRESRALLQGALTDFEAKKYDDALAKLTEANQKMPDDPAVLNLLGAAHTKKKNFAAAKQYFDRALAKQPGFFPAKFNVGELLFLEGRYAEARGFFAQMLRDDPANELLQFKVFLCELQLGDPDSVTKALKAIRYPGNTPAWYFGQAVWQLKYGNKKKALEYVNGARFIFGTKTVLFEETCHDIGLDIR